MRMGHKPNLMWTHNNIVHDKCIQGLSILQRYLIVNTPHTNTGQQTVEVILLTECTYLLILLSSIAWLCCKVKLLSDNKKAINYSSSSRINTLLHIIKATQHMHSPYIKYTTTGPR